MYRGSDFVVVPSKQRSNYVYNTRLPRMMLLPFPHPIQSQINIDTVEISLPAHRRIVLSEPYQEIIVSNVKLLFETQANTRPK